MKEKIGIIGKGNVGKALQAGVQRAGHEVRMVGRGSEVPATAAWADVVILAVPFGALDALAAEIASAVKGKPVIDVSNALAKAGGLALGFSTSGAEELQKKLPGAMVMKAFNTIFAQNMSSGKVKNAALFMPVAGDDAKAKGVVLQLARDIGFDAVDAGPLANARLLEPLGFLNIQLGYVVNKGLGGAIGLTLVR
jgi:8-hydroxy-5-deazaflavin:NADPH oxidoreductase